MEGRPPEKIRELHSRVAALVAEILDTPIERVPAPTSPSSTPEGWGIGGVPADVVPRRRPVAARPPRGRRPRRHVTNDPPASQRAAPAVLY